MSQVFRLRKVNESDIHLLFDWANDSLTRQNSFHSEPISWEEHEAWFKKTLSNPRRQIYIYCEGEKPVGQVRIDFSDDGLEAQVNYSIASKYRGLGHGKNMLSLLVIQVKQDFPDVKKLVAEVKPENIASQRCFLDMGYKEQYRMYEYDLNIAVDSPVLGKRDFPQNGGGHRPTN